MPTFEDELVIEPGHTEKNYWADLWRYRELFFILASRDVAVRYKQSTKDKNHSVFCFPLRIRRAGFGS